MTRLRTSSALSLVLILASPRAHTAAGALDAPAEHHSPSQVTARARLATVAVIAAFNERPTVPGLKPNASRLSMAMRHPSQSGLDALIQTFLSDPVSFMQAGDSAYLNKEIGHYDQRHNADALRLFRSLSLGHLDPEILRSHVSRFSGGQGQVQSAPAASSRDSLPLAPEAPAHRSRLPLVIFVVIGLALLAVVAIVVLSNRR